MLFLAKPIHVAKKRTDQSAASIPIEGLLGKAPQVCVCVCVPLCRRSMIDWVVSCARTRVSRNNIPISLAILHILIALLPPPPTVLGSVGHGERAYSLHAPHSC
jgi:hypothetical protein